MLWSMTDTASATPARRKFTAIIHVEDGEFVALCPELDVASQGATREEALENLREAVELFLECADPAEIASRLDGSLTVTEFEAHPAG